MKRVLSISSVMCAIALLASPVEGGAAGQGTVPGTNWCDMTTAQRTKICEESDCLPADQKKTLNDLKGEKPDGAESTWAKAGGVCIGTASNRGNALARTIYDETTGKTTGVVIFIEWFTASAPNMKFALMQEANRIGFGPLFPNPTAGEPYGGLSTPEKYFRNVIALINNLLVKLRDARSRITFGSIDRPSGTSEGDWKKEICKNLEHGKTLLARVKEDKKKVKKWIAFGKSKGYNVTQQENDLKKVCKELDDAEKALTKAETAKSA